ncbi:MAG: phosphatidylserine decarboxylase [Nanoarchaeota archaeon]
MIIWIIIVTFFLLLISFLLNFYRDPERTIPKGNNIVSPADGKVISIIDTAKNNVRINKGFLGKIKSYSKDVAPECKIISIFMSPLDVHINRAPISGKVVYAKHSKGKFFRAYNLEKSFENEKNEILIENKKMKVKVIQIAGFLARRIICHVKKNDKVDKGGKIGKISLGSQATLMLPKNVEIKVKLGQKVKAGETIIASIKWQ